MKGIRMEKDSGKKKIRLRVFGIAAAVLVIAAVAAVLIVCRGDLSAAGLRDGLRTLTGGSSMMDCSIRSKSSSNGSSSSSISFNNSASKSARSDLIGGSIWIEFLKAIRSLGFAVR